MGYRIKLSSFLETLPSFQTILARKAFLYRSGLDELLPGVSLDGDTRTYLNLLLENLFEYGSLTDKRDPILALLEVVKQDVGLEKRQFVDSLIGDYQSEQIEHFSQEIQIGKKNLPDTSDLEYRIPEYDRVQKILGTKEFTSLFDKICSWSKLDQIPESGGWGKSWVDAFEYISERKLTSFEKAEGGIISTFIVIRALQYYEVSQSVFMMQSFVDKATRYLLKRQTHSGLFGRLVQSRSGIEIHPSLRHTAFAASTLIDLEAKPTAILEGIRKLLTWNESQIDDDAAPSIAIASIVNVIDKFRSNSKLMQIVQTEDDIFPILFRWAKIKQLLYRKLVDIINDNAPFYPFWKPYGNYQRDLFYTSLTTIDLITSELPPFIEVKLERMLNMIMSHEIEGGLPYDPQGTLPDVGFTAYFTSVVLRREFLIQLDDIEFARRLVSTALRYLRFVKANYNNKRLMRLTYCDTLPNILLLHMKVSNNANS